MSKRVKKQKKFKEEKYVRKPCTACEGTGITNSFVGACYVCKGEGFIYLLIKK
jgi:DnaJ-class molecular chaperone